MTSRPPGANLRRMLAEFPWIEIVGEAGNVEDAAEKVGALSPGLLFLDIHMPGGSGFDLLARLEYLPRVIFTTAHDEHAVRAFEVNALDYLLKPIDPRASRCRAGQGEDASRPHPDRTPCLSRSSSGTGRAAGSCPWARYGS